MNKLKNSTKYCFLNYQAGRLGIEPRFTASKAAVLPLDDLPIYFHISKLKLKYENNTDNHTPKSLFFKMVVV